MATDEVTISTLEKHQRESMELLQMEKSIRVSNMALLLSICICACLMFVGARHFSRDGLALVCVITLPWLIVARVSNKVICTAAALKYRKIRVRHPYALVAEDLKKLNETALFCLEMEVKNLPR